jgi:arabinogalactan endo-1,4-beta-galactosidase
MIGKILTIIFICTLFSSFACKKTNHEEPVKTTKSVFKWDEFSMGADLSYINQIEANGGIYKDSAKVKDPFLIFASHGANTVRVRLWHNPEWMKAFTGGKMYNNLTDAEKTIRRAKQAGMAVNLDIHYSDEWADPQKQYIPKAWEGLSLAVLSDSVYKYTLNVLQYLEAKNLTPEMVQIGNENNTGMLWPVGKVENENWAAFGTLLKSGIKAVRDFSANSAIKPKIILHVAQLQNAEWWANGVYNKAGVKDFDIIGLSHYAKWSTISSGTEIERIIRQLKMLYAKDVMIVEVAYPWTSQNADNYGNIISGSDSVSGYAITPEGQKKYMIDLTQHIMNAGGKGIMYWEPAWITSGMVEQWGTGSAWDNCTFFDFQGNALPVFDHYNNEYTF